jgi:hypothetical protein
MATRGRTVDGAALIALAPGVSLARGRVEDQITGHRYPLEGVGAEVLRELVKGRMLAEVESSVVRRYSVSLEKVAGDLGYFLGELDRQGLISVRQSPLAGLRAFVRALIAAAPSPLALLMVDTSTLAQPAKRYPPTLAWVVLACLEAQSLLFIAALGVIAVAVGAKLALAWQLQSASMYLAVSASAGPVLALLVFAVLFISHEAGHLLAVRALGMKPRSVACRIGGVGISYLPGRPLQMLLVALAGPLTAFTLAIGLAVGLSFHPIPELGVGKLDVSYIILFGMLHLWSLRPWAADGRQLAAAVFDLGADLRHRPQAGDGTA